MSKALLYNIYNALFMAFVCFIPFEDYFNAVPNILLGSLAFINLFFITKSQIINVLKSKNVIYLGILVGYIFVLSVSHNRVYEDYFILSKLIIPLAIIWLSLPLKNIQNSKYAFIVATTLAVSISLVNVLIYIYTNNDFEFRKGGYINELLVSERLYIGFCAALSFIFSIDIAFKTKIKKVQLIAILVCFILCGFIFLIVARAALLTVVFTLIVLAFSKFNLKLKLIFTAALIIFISLFIGENENITNRFLHSHDVYRKDLVAKIKKHEPRVIIWSCAFGILSNQHHPILGNGFHQTKEQLVKCYQKEIDVDRKKEWFVTSRFNTHNQFLDFLLSTGIIGLMLFLGFLFHLFKESKRDFFAISTIGALILILFVDNILHRQIGGYLLGICVILILEQKLKLTEKQ